MARFDGCPFTHQDHYLVAHSLANGVSLDPLPGILSRTKEEIESLANDDATRRIQAQIATGSWVHDPFVYQQTGWSQSEDTILEAFHRRGATSAEIAERLMRRAWEITDRLAQKRGRERDATCQHAFTHAPSFPFIFCTKCGTVKSLSL